MFRVVLIAMTAWIESSWRGGHLRSHQTRPDVAIS